MENVNITISLMNSILAYLGRRPYVEVADLINKLSDELEKQKKAEVKENG